MQGNGINKNPLQEDTRPKGIVLINYTLLLFSIFHLLKFSQVIIRWDILSSLALSISPFLQGAEGLIWALSGLILAWGSWKRKSWAPAGILVGSLIFTLLSWIKLFLTCESSVLKNRWPVNIVLTIIGLGTLVGILYQKSTRSYFGKNAVKIP